MKKPPLGLRPKIIADEMRLREIKEAIQRYLDEDYIIPELWFEEYNTLIEEMKKHTVEAY